MHLLFMALAVAFIGSFAATYGIALLYYILFPKQAINPMRVSASFTKKEWFKIVRISSLVYASMFTSAFIFFSFGKGTISMNVYSSLAIAAVGIIGLWSFAYLIFLIGKTPEQDAKI